MPRTLTLTRNNASPRRRNLFLLLVGLTLLALCVPGLYQPHVHAATTFNVNSTGDGTDSDLTDNVCNDGSGNCSLRAAIQQANATAGTDTININVNGTINLIGALSDITTDMNINGPGANLLTVTRNTGGFYSINVASGVTVSISGLTLTGGGASMFQSGGVRRIRNRRREHPERLGSLLSHDRRGSRPLRLHKGDGQTVLRAGRDREDHQRAGRRRLLR